MDGMIIRTMKAPPHELKEPEYKTIVSMIFCRTLVCLLLHPLKLYTMMFFVDVLGSRKKYPVLEDGFLKHKLHVKSLLIGREYIFVLKLIQHSIAPIIFFLKYIS